MQGDTAPRRNNSTRRRMETPRRDEPEMGDSPTPNGWANVTSFPSIYDRWQKRARGFVVQTEAHESHGLRDAQTALQAPAEQFGVTNRHEEAGAGKCLGRADEGLEFAVALADGVSKETEGCGIAGNTPVVLDDAGRALPDRVE